MKFKTVLAPVLLIVGLSSCGRRLDWTQDAQLHDGRTLVLERRSEFGPSFPGNSGLEIGQTISFLHPDTGKTYLLAHPGWLAASHDRL